MKSTSAIRTLVTGLIFYSVFTISCTHNNELPPTPYEKANQGIGGIMYDKYWSAEAKFDQNDPNIDTYKDNANFFRCKQCHAWDGLGNAGSYIGRAPSTTRPNVDGLNLYAMVQNTSADELFNAMKKSTGRRDISYDLSQYDPATDKTEGDKMPDYSQILSDAQIWDIVKFLKEGMLDVTQLYEGTYTGSYPDGTATYSNLGLASGDDVNGNVYYSANCASCHGADGLQILMDDMGVGGFARSKAYEVQHKVKFGQLGSSMVGEFDITLDEMRDLYKALADDTKFPDGGPVSFANNIQTIFTASCIFCHSGASPSAGLDLSEGNAYASISIPKYINLGTPNQSLIYTKPLSGHPGTYSATEAATVLKWIEEGALNN